MHLNTLNHVKYGPVIKGYEEKFLSQYSNLRREQDGNIIYLTGEPHPLMNISPLKTGTVVMKKSRSKRQKCNYKTPGYILKKCGRCINCCTNPNCKHQKDKLKKLQ